MKNIYKTIICLIVFAMMISGCSSTSTGENAVLQFFGFNNPANGSAPAGKPSEQKAQNPPQADSDPFGVDAKSGSQTGSSMSNLDWDDFDPSLVEFPDQVAETKISSSVQDDWEDDPDAWSFSSSSFEDVSLETQEKQVPGNYPPNPSGPGYPNQNPPVPPANPNQNPPVPPANPNQNPPMPPVNPGPNQNIRPSSNPPYNFFRIDSCPVFCPMHEFPRTGITAGMSSEISKSVSYTPTNMKLTIPRLNVTEDIVVVPVVDGSFPVESLGTKIGLLEGSGPGPEDLFVLVGHNHIDMQAPGPFRELSALKESDLIFVQGAKNASRTFVVYANEKFGSEDIEGLLSYAKPGCMILITCEDESIEGGYLNRRVIFAEAKED